jgi:hypothetical protein
MTALRRTLLAQAALWALLGLALALAPRFTLVSLFGQPAPSDPAWLRIAGVQAIGLSMLEVLVSRRLEDLWWWAWAFELVTVAAASVAVLNLAFGLDPGQSAGVWWALSAVTVALAFGLLWALSRTARANPP